VNVHTDKLPYCDLQRTDPASRQRGRPTETGQQIPDPNSWKGSNIWSKVHNVGSTPRHTLSDYDLSLERAPHRDRTTHSRRKLLKGSNMCQTSTKWARHKTYWLTDWMSAVKWLWLWPVVREGATQWQDNKFQTQALEREAISGQTSTKWARHEDILTDWLTDWLSAVEWLWLCPLVREGARQRQENKFQSQTLEKEAISGQTSTNWTRHQDIQTDWLTVSRRVTLTLSSRQRGCSTETGKQISEPNSWKGTFDWPRHLLELSGKLHAPAALPPMKNPTESIEGWLGYRTSQDY
jgi:hypothetical protein